MLRETASPVGQNNALLYTERFSRVFLKKNRMIFVLKRELGGWAVSYLPPMVANGFRSPDGTTMRLTPNLLALMPCTENEKNTRIRQSVL